MNKPTEFRSFIEVVGDLDDGRVVEEMTHQLREVVRAARSAKKKASVTLKIDVTPDGDRQFIVNATVKPTIPTPTPGMTMFFATESGELRKDDPKQLPLKDVGKPAAPLRSIGGDAGADQGA